MGDFTQELESFRPSLPFLDTIDPMMIDNSSNLNYHQSFLAFSNDSHHQPLDQVFHQSNRSMVLTTENAISKKRKSKGLESSCENSSSQNNSSGGRRKMKRVKSSDQKEEEKPMDVVHVRARRGEATDSHSLAERVRRGKINERLRCLQDIVPGCYKTMGMAVMLDEIINYVQSLQNQVEFLSMKLTAATTYYDFNSETDAIETMQRLQADEFERVMRQGYDYGGLTSLGSSYPSFP